MKKNKILPLIVFFILISLGSFFIGVKYQQKKTLSNFSQSALMGNSRGLGRNTQTANINNPELKNRGQAPGFRQSLGEIINIDDKSITVKLADGSSKIVLLSESTIINQSVKATISDLKVGTKVSVSGDTNTDGSVVGRNIEIDPVFATISPVPTQ